MLMQSAMPFGYGWRACVNAFRRAFIARQKRLINTSARQRSFVSRWVKKKKICIINPRTSTDFQRGRISMAIVISTWYSCTRVGLTARPSGVNFLSRNPRQLRRVRDFRILWRSTAARRTENVSIIFVFTFRLSKWTDREKKKKNPVIKNTVLFSFHSYVCADDIIKTSLIALCMRASVKVCSVHDETRVPGWSNNTIL